MTGAAHQKIKGYLRQEEREVTNNIIKAIDDLELPKNAYVSEQISLKNKISDYLDILEKLKNRYKTISELYLIELEERVYKQ